jgi:superoxide dismutase
VWAHIADGAAVASRVGGTVAACPTYTLPDLSYDYGALAPHLSAEIIELHHDKHHKTYVDGANTSIDKLAEARAAKKWDSLVGSSRRSRSTSAATCCTASTGRTCRRTAAASRR